MDTYLAIASKRDRREYSDRPVPEDVLTSILDAGRVAGSASNRQPWRFFVVTSSDARERLAETVYAAGNISKAPLAVAIVTPEGGQPLDVGRAAQNMMLAAWDEGVVSCPNGMPDAKRAAEALGIEGDELPVIILSFGYPPREIDPESRTPAEWSAAANRKPLEELVTRL